MRLRNINILLVVLTLSLASCTKFLDEQPKKSGVVPKTVNELITFYYSGIQKNSSFYRALTNEDLALPFTQQDIKNENGMTKRASLFFAPLFLRDYRSERANGGGSLWANSYAAINNHNYMIKMSDSEEIEGTSAEREKLKSYGRFYRAKLYFDLVTSFCQPWEPGVNDDALGLVIRDQYNIEFSEDNLARKSLKETYDFIEADLKASLNVDEGNQKWKITKAAVHAFTARFYLMIGKYDEADKQADLALAVNSELCDYTPYTTETVSINRASVKVVSEIYNKDFQNELVEIPEEYFIETLQVFQYPFFPSRELLNLYDNDGANNDVRRLFFPENGVAASMFLKHTKSPTAKLPYWLGYQYGLMAFPGVSEMILIKAECAAREGKLAIAKSELNTLRSKRIKNYNDQNVAKINTKEAAIQFVLNERRRERPFILRGLDIRRLKALDHKDLNVKREFFDMTENEVLTTHKTYILTQDGLADKLYEQDIQLSQGMLIQNP